MEMSDVLARHTVEEYKMLVDNVLDAAFRRDTFQRLKECQALCYNRAETNVEEKIYSIIDDVMTEFSTTNDVPMFKDVVDDCWDEIQSRQGDGYAGIQFKFPALNEYATIEPGELFIFAAEAKQGKSMMLLNCAVDLMKKDLKEEIKRGVQTIQYQVLTLMTTNGQTPFITVFMYLGEVEDERTKADLAMIIEEVVRQRYQGVKNEKGAWITPAFPKLIYVLEEDNIREDSEYFYLTKLCAKCSVKRLVPDYISEKMMIQNKIDTNGDGHCFPCMGCRSFLTPYLDENGKPKYYGRFNQGVVTINLPDVGLSAVKRMEGITYVNDEQYQKRKEEIFWEIFEERLELCHKALRLRHERLLGTLSDASPIHWQNGGLARLKKGETIDKLLYGGYSTLSLGYAGLYECVKAMTGKSHTDDDAKPFALAIMQKMNDKCAEWKAAENIDYSLYGTPIESTTYKFAKCLQKRFGVIEGITDRNYITNSYHVHVTEKINAFDKLRFESEFQQLSPGGAISYIETANLSNNVEAAIEVIKYIYDHIMYAELNTKSDFCQECGYDGEIQIVENEDGKLIWECPNCGNRDRAKMNIARRTCGYIGVNDFNQGRTQEIKERYVHLGGE